MLQQTFCHLNGIGRKTEQSLWKAGVLTWDMWQEPPPVRLPNSSRIEAIETLEQSLSAAKDDPVFFTKRLKSHEHWRIFPHFRKQTAFVDIETTGLHDSAEITTIALYDGVEIRTYVNGENLEDFVDDIYKYKVIGSYNGKSFDVPFIEKYFKIDLPHAQIDLRYILSKLGFKGGLKGCEKQMGIDRYDLDGVDGYFAVLLWNEYEKNRDISALETLLAYNIADTVNLELLLVKAYNMHIQKTPFHASHTIETPFTPDIPFQPNMSTVSKIKRKYQFSL